MSSSANEDREHSETNSMEESNLNTIKFLRARLLSERSVSKTARQRTDELAKKVAELEDQLKFVALQRKKAEKATADVLAILENNGISDVSEEFDSCSEQGESTEEFKARNGSLTSKETSTNAKFRKNEKESYSSSEIESSPSTGRNLSWRSTKDSQHSLEKKKYMDSVRRRANFSSNSSSARRMGNSCRRIRRRETRSIDKLQNDGSEKATYSRDASNCSDCDPAALAESSRYANGESPLESPTTETTSGAQKVNGHYFNVHQKEEDMESALQHQAQLIGQYEEEEKAQREWEEKFRENNSCTQDSFDPGNHSDITEERFETKSPEPPCAPGATDSDNQETKQDSTNARFGEEPGTSKSSPAVTDAEKQNMPDEKYSREYSASEFSFPVSEKSNQEFSRKHHEASTRRSQQYPPMVSTISHTPSNISSGSPSSFELAVVPQETSNSLGSVLQALQQAKLSLHGKLGNSPQVEGGSSINAVNPSNTETNHVSSYPIPSGIPGLFRLPTDYPVEATTRAYQGNGVQQSFANYPSEIAPGRFLSESFVESRSALYGDPFHSVPNRPLAPETRLGYSPQRSLFLSQPRLSEALSDRMNHFDAYRNPVPPQLTDSYPFLPDVARHLSLNEESYSRSSERGLPPVMRLSSYDGRAGPNTYR
ncbi:hypothetical protein ACS0TY_000699 [Phlomoides rotata]